MNNYREAYENYYRNINKKSDLRTPENRNILQLKNKENNYRRDRQPDNIISKEYWIKRFESEMAGSMVIMLVLFGLKYFPADGTRYLYNKCKSIIATNITYDQSIETLKDIEIGTFKGEDFNIDGFTFDDLKKENIKKELIECMSYIKNNSFKIEEKDA